MNICIRNQTGRLGNFIIQIKNALHIATYNNYNVILPQHEYFNTSYIIINKNVDATAPHITDKDEFYLCQQFKALNPEIFRSNTEIVSRIMKDIFIFKNIESLGVNDLVIHIRSGDIFSASPHPEYIMPPLSYYTNIIENNTYDQIYLIAEDTLNPCINKLLELYPNIHFNIQSLEKDIEVVLSATNIVISYGTFITELLTVSDNIKNVYSPNYSDYQTITLYETPHYNLTMIDLTHYRDEMRPWTNTPHQINKMLSFV